MSVDIEQHSDTARVGQTRQGPWIRWAWWLVPVAAVCVLGMQWYWAHRVPDSQTWSDVIGHVTDHWQPGDGLWVTPAWHAVPWDEVEHRLRDKNAETSGIVVPVKHPLTADIIRYRRLWVVAVEPWAEEIPGMAKVATRHDFGRLIAVSLLEREYGEPTFDALAQLGSATVSRKSPDGRADRCMWASDRFRCGSQPWKEVRSRVAQVGSTRRRVIVAHAFPDKGSVILQYTGVTLGDVLEGGVGNTMWAVRHQVGSDVTYRIWVGDKEVFGVTLAPGDFSWNSFRIELGELSGKIADIRVEISADNTQWRELGFDLVSYHQRTEVSLTKPLRQVVVTSGYRPGFL
ncbi:MAG: hypothetical protein HUU55_15685 [Myxococcales bacterium]|nr:hypothetical protein [Myxococcales bacterium]